MVDQSPVARCVYASIATATRLYDRRHDAGFAAALDGTWCLRAACAGFGAPRAQHHAPRRSHAVGRRPARDPDDALLPVPARGGEGTRRTRGGGSRLAGPARTRHGDGRRTTPRHDRAQETQPPASPAGPTFGPALVRRRSPARHSGTSFRTTRCACRTEAGLSSPRGSTPMPWPYSPSSRSWSRSAGQRSATGSLTSRTTPRLPSAGPTGSCRRGRRLPAGTVPGAADRDISSGSPSSRARLRSAPDPR